jgi:hypothetical protein
VRLIGSDEWRPGVVRQVRGSAARTDDRLLAAQVPVPHPNSVTVEIEIQQESQQNSFCNIGRLAEVRFPRHFGFLADLSRMVSRLSGGVIETASGAQKSN